MGAWRIAVGFLGNRQASQKSRRDIYLGYLS
jgi:hypothetical protein